MRRSGPMTAGIGALLAMLMGCTSSVQPAVFPEPNVTTRQIVAIANAKLAGREFAPRLIVDLRSLPGNPPAGAALESSGYVFHSGSRFLFTRRALAQSSPCGDQAPTCLRLPFGRNANVHGDLVELYTPGDKFSQEWTVWFTHRVMATDALSKAADREGFATTNLSTTRPCLQTWHAKVELLMQFDLATPDNPPVFVQNNDLRLRTNLDKSDESRQCSLPLFENERAETPAWARRTVASS